MGGTSHQKKTGTLISGWKDGEYAMPAVGRISTNLSLSDVAGFVAFLFIGFFTTGFFVAVVTFGFADASGGSGFMQVSVPRAALLLAQGAGRLIRSIDDRGVVAILDSRIVTKRYGSVILNSMPPLWRTSDGAVVRDSLKRLRETL